MIKLKHDLPLDIATAKSAGAAKWRNTRTTWAKVAESLKETERTSETIKQYFSYTKDKQDEIKDVGGFVGGKLLPGTGMLKGKEVTFNPPFGWRRKGFVEHRQLVALDVDFGTLDVWLDFKLLEYAGLVYSTHKHTPDSPRLRIVFPLDRPVNPDEYECIARVAASWLGIDMFDDTTYQPTRLMYYPSTARDGEYIFDLVDAPVLRADDVLAELEDWTDVTSWPQSSRETEVRRAAGDKVEDPFSKHGIVGAFCRAYTIEEAIAEFLADVYVPCDDMGRYSYVAGSTSGGLVIYDHKLAYSHHNTDPAGGKLCNAFDLVRLHKFADLDEKVKEGTAPERLPSYRAMAEFAGKLKPVKKEIIKERRENQGAEYDEAENAAREVGASDEWVGDLETEGRNGKIKSTIDNIVRILENDEILKDRFALNIFQQREVILKSVPWDKEGTQYPRSMRDSDDAQIRLYLERCYDITGATKIYDALAVVIQANSFHPIKDYLNACEWDGVERLDSLLIDCLGAPDTEYTRAVTRKFFTAAVARIYRPGVKFENMLTIIGEQGVGKSTLLGLMGGDWFSDSITALNDNKAIEGLQGAWIIELGEMAGMRKAEVEAVKHFVSKREDRYRVAYGKRLEYFPRQCVFAPTTNEDDPLRDATGNRRYWVVNCKGGHIEYPVWEYLTQVVISQLWAEARARFEDGEQLYLTGEREAEARRVQDAHLEKDDRTGLIADYLDRSLPGNWETLEPYERRQWLTEPLNFDKGTVTRDSVCVMAIWAECLGKNPEDMTRRDSFEIARILKGLREWVPGPAARFTYYGVQKRYTRV